MNFRDVLKALALYPGEAPDARIFRRPRLALSSWLWVTA